MYQVTLGNEESTVSDELSVLIDKTAPVPGGGVAGLSLSKTPMKLSAMALRPDTWSGTLTGYAPGYRLTTALPWAMSLQCIGGQT